MYTREEASQVRKNFWTSFGQYMKPVKGAAGDTVNWLNYKTGVKHLYFRMDAGKRDAAVSIEISHPDSHLRAAMYQQLMSLKGLLEENTGEDWSWQADVYDEDGRLISRITTALENVNIFSSSDWPAIISFFKPRIIALDAFWSVARDLFVV
ncbi:MAG: DUF4268 domain-containing protein [Chitinophagaceae bacterium]|nr:MAG: DUF4268 domain-containing protein [Chitinophagaceae bacterium]